MTKIKIYPIDTNISGGDKWIGSDAQESGRTKNFTVSGLSNYFNESRSIDLSNALSFKYDTVEEGDDRANGSFSFETEVGATVSFSSITDLIIHSRTTDGHYVADFMTSFVRNIVMFCKSDDPNKFAFYKVSSYGENESEAGFYDISLEYIDGNGSVEEDEYYFVSLLQLDNDYSDKHNSLTFTTSTFNPNVEQLNGRAMRYIDFEHNLEKYPSITVTEIGSPDIVAFVPVKYLNNNTVRVYFNGVTNGTIYAN